MKGVKYNLKFRKSKTEFIIKKDLTMLQICNDIKELMKEHHLADNIKCNNQNI